GVGASPSFCRKVRPMFAVSCADVAVMPSTALTIAIGSPLTNALGIAGRVGSQATSQFLVAAVGAPGARSQLPDELAACPAGAAACPAGAAACPTGAAACPAGAAAC